MNSDHDRLCSSSEWAEYLAGELVPWALAGLDPGKEFLELGGGFGAATGRLVEYRSRLTVVEHDPVLAHQLGERFPAAEVMLADATSTGLAPASFDAAACFTMLHHVTPLSHQDKLFAEVVRVLKPGGWFAGTDSLASDGLRAFHEGDVYHPVDPRTLPARLEAAGLAGVEVELGDRVFRFRCFRAAA